MTLTLVFALALLVVASFLAVVRGRTGAIQSAAELADRLSTVDTEAFKNLVSITEMEFLRASLPGSHFREVQRRRLWVAMKYVNLLSENAAAILRYGEASSKVPIDEVRSAGQGLARNAIRLRLLAFPVRLKLCVCMVAPQVTPSWKPFLGSYDEMKLRVHRLTELQMAR